MSQRVSVIDTHTGGEPTRVVIAGGPDLGAGIDGRASGRLSRAARHISLGGRQRAARLGRHGRRDRAAAGRSSLRRRRDLSSTTSATWVCAATARSVSRWHWLTWDGSDRARIGSKRRSATSRSRLEGPNTVTIENVESYRLAKDVRDRSAGTARLTSATLAWGGNWFFLVHDHGETLSVANVERLTDVTWRIRQALSERGHHRHRRRPRSTISSCSGRPSQPEADSKNFVLCPGRAYDRSPCGTGTSAKLACLAADGKLTEGQVWRQESIIGSLFEGTVRIVGAGVRPRIRGTAYRQCRVHSAHRPGRPLRDGDPSMSDRGFNRGKPS